MKQGSGDSDGNRILQDQKQKLLQDSGAPAPAFYRELPLKKKLLLIGDMLSFHLRYNNRYPSRDYRE